MHSKAPNAGDPLGKFRLGALFRSGEGLQKNEALGLGLQKEAIEIWAKQGLDEGDPFSLEPIPKPPA